MLEQLWNGVYILHREPYWADKRCQVVLAVNPTDPTMPFTVCVDFSAAGGVVKLGGWANEPHPSLRDPNYGEIEYFSTFGEAITDFRIKKRGTVV